MRPTLQLRSLRDTTLWQRLTEGYRDDDAALAQGLATNLLSVCQDAVDRIKNFSHLHPQFTLHDEVHLLRVVYLMGKLIPDDVLEQLNPVEVFLLVLSAYFHDQGMVLEGLELADLECNPAYELFCRNWELEHPNVEQIRQRLRDSHIGHEEQERCIRLSAELRAIMFTDYIRKTHGERSAAFVREKLSDNQYLYIGRTCVADALAKLCASHVKSTSELTSENGYHFDESISTYKVNMPYLALILRLADILDFDRDRTPEVLRRTIHFTSDVSVTEWAKHGGVEGWTIEPETIRFSIRCEHPAYQKAAFRFMDWIDEELAAAHTLIAKVPGKSLGYPLPLPLRTDRTRIQPKNDAYIYRDLEFSLSRDEVVKLLMTDRLYQSPSLAIRELLQNALDALRYRRALVKREENVDWPHGKVVLVHALDGSGREVVRCVDNGVGMTLDVIERFLTKAGRSYYRSYEFERERSSFAEHGCDFDPCSQFGIGFMACFMLGDHISIRTRRYFGPNKAPGKPLLVEINGLSGLLLIKEDPGYREFGTSVEITLRSKNSFFDTDDDPVRILKVTQQYAQACEFTIEARCELPEMQGRVVVPPGVETRLTEIEEAHLEHSITLEQDLSRIHANLSGKLRCSFLMEDGELKVATARARVDSDYLYLNSSNGYVRTAQLKPNVLCLDGIVVFSSQSFGGFGRARNSINVGRASFVADVRGLLKPPVTPARTVPEVPHPHWRRVSALLNRGYGSLWEQVIDGIGTIVQACDFWDLVRLYKPWLPWAAPHKLWSKLSVPIRHRDGEGTIAWRPLSQLGRLTLLMGQIRDREWPILTLSDGTCINTWEVEEDVTEITVHTNDILISTVVSLGTVLLSEGEPCLSIREPDGGDEPWQTHVGSPRSYRFAPVPYIGALKHAVSAEMPLSTVNLNHPLLREARKAYYVVEPPLLQTFAATAVNCFSDSETHVNIASKSPFVTRTMRRLGRLFKSIRWDKFNEHLAPPYSIWVRTQGLVEITGAELSRWATAPVEPEDEY